MLVSATSSVVHSTVLTDTNKVLKHRSESFLPKCSQHLPEPFNSAESMEVTHTFPALKISIVSSIQPIFCKPTKIELQHHII